MRGNYLLRCVMSIVLSIASMLTASSQYRVFTIGDSTVQDYNDGYAPRKGWGQMLSFFFDKNKVVVYNRAVGGTSSKSFYNDHWAKVRSQLKAGDYVFIQFGINDRNKDPNRYAPSDTFNEYIKKFVSETKAKGAFPVLVSTVRRNAWQNGKPYDSYHEHPQLMRDLASSLKLPLVDLDKFCYDLFVAQGQLYAQRHITMNLVAGEYPNYKNGNSDDVHYQEAGATENARFVVETIEKSNDANLKKLAACTLPRHKVTIKINDPSKAKTLSRTAEFPAGINVTLKTIPQDKAKFLRWEDGNGKTVATNSLKVVTMGNSDVTYKAVYESNIVEQPVIDENADIEIDNKNKTLTAPSASSYKWYFNNAQIAGGNGKSVAVESNGTYSVELFDAKGKLAKRIDICVTIGKDGVIRKIYLIGDSTVCDYKSDKFPMTGWGQVLKYFFNSNIQIENHAIGGRSSRSFREQGRWKTVENALKPGDFVFIQFGHNDRDNSKAERYTPVDKYKLYIDSFVVETRAKGAIPVLVTPMVMNAWKNNAMRNVFTESGNDYRGAMAAVAKERKCALVDLNMKSYNYFKQFDSDYLSSFFYNSYVAGEYPNYPKGGTDGTHFQEMGALTLCRFITEELKGSEDPYICALQAYLKPQYNVTVKANAEGAGKITQSAMFPEGAPVSVKVLPASGKKFQYWNQSGIVKDKTSIFRFTLGPAATTLTAVFEGGSEVATVLPQSFPEGKKRVAYITDPDGATYNDDPIKPMLKNCDDLFIWEIAASNSGVDLSAFDLVVISEETASSAPVMAGLEGLAKPMLSMKVHGYKNAEGAWGWAANGFGDNTTATTIVVADAFKGHPMFKDVTFQNGNEVQMVSEVNVKALTYMNPKSFTGAKGEISSIASIKGEDQVSILEIEPGSTVAGTRISEPYIQIGLNSSSYANLTEDGLSVVKNACYYLLGMNNGNVANAELLQKGNHEIKVTPQPANDKINVSIDSPYAAVAEYSVVNALGTNVKRGFWEIMAGENNMSVDVSALANGVCILKVRGGSIFETIKFIVKK